MTPPQSGVLPFVMDADTRKAALRGRLVRIDDVASTILARHDYPPQIAELTAEAMALSVCLASTMDYDGVFTLQAKGDASVKTLFADVTSQGALRAYAQFDENALDKNAELGDPAPIIKLMGSGYLAFTVDQQQKGRHQGIVPIEDPDLNAVAMRYFFNSEQIDSALIIAARPQQDKRQNKKQHKKWHAAALMLQRIPEIGGKHDNIIPISDKESDAWHTVCTLMATCTRDELLDPELPPDTLLFRLFQEFKVSTLPFRNINDQCRCSPERVQRMIEQLDQKEQHELAENGVITLTCEFCKKTHTKKIAP